MKIINKIIVIIISITAFSYFIPIEIIAEASVDNIKFESITTKQGLSQNTVYAIVQDKYGYLWFGTRDGLNKYDGINFTTYRYNPSDPYSLANNTINWLYKDSNDDIWIATEYGLHKYNRENNTFNRYLNDPNNPDSISSNSISKIYEDSFGNLWIGTSNGLNKFDRELNRFIHYFNESDNPKSISGKYIHSIYEDKNGNLWIGTDYGLNKYNRKTETFSHYLHDANDSNSIINNTVRSIFEDSFGNFWVGTNDGLNKFDREKNVFIKYVPESDNPESISGNIIYSLYEDSFNNFWIGTNNGLNKFDRELNSFTHYFYDPDDPYSINSNSIWSIYEDRDHILWIGTRNGGVNKLDYGKEAFTYYKNKLYDSNSLSSNIIWSVYEDHNGILWIGTDYGLNCYNPKTETFTHYLNDPNDPGSISYNVVLSIYEDSYNTLWIGTASGLNRFNSETNDFTHYFCDPNDESTLSGDFVRYIYEDSENNLWISTTGLDKFDRNTETIDRYASVIDHSNTIKKILEDQNEVLWLGTNYGLYKYDKKIDALTQYLYDINGYNSISNNEITSLYEDCYGNLWIGTNYGLNQLVNTTNIFINYTSENGLRSNLIKGILGDDSGNLWISTMGGLSKFDPYTGNFTNFTVKDGLQGDEFNQGSCFKSSSGELFFGGLYGLTSFYPEAITEDTTIPNVVINSFTLVDKTISFNEPIEDIKEITLPYADNSFVIDFVALNYKSPESSQYSFKLENFDTNWQYCSALNSSIRYTNIPSGEYTFRVIASNSDGIWNEEGASLKIIITPPFWQEWWFILIIILMGLMIIMSLIKYRTYTLNKYAQILEAQVEEKTNELAQKNKHLEEEMNNKIRYTRALVHELKTPLTPLLASSDFLCSELEDRIPLRFARNINEGALNLSKRIDELLDLAKSETGMIDIKPNQVDLKILIKNIIDYIKPEIIKKNLNFNSLIPRNVPKINADEERLRQVILNLINNAIKYTPTEGNIVLKVYENNSGIVIQIKDTGIGIDKKEIEHLFEPYHRLENGLRRTGGMGLGLYISKTIIELHGGRISVKSQKGVGTSFNVWLPIK